MGYQRIVRVLSGALIYVALDVLGANTVLAQSAQDSASILPLAPAAQDRLVIPTTHDGIGRIVARVMINGAGPFRFVVDTGATHSAVSKPLVQKLNLTNGKAGASSVLLSSVTGSAQVAMVRIES